MSTHTPGPWKVETRTRSGEFVRTTHITGPDGAHLANVGPCNIEANARLIASAPDLLAALKRALSLVEELPHPNNYMAATIRETIAIAEGRA